MTASSARGDSQGLGIAQLAQSSFALITELQASSGAYPASPTFSAYTGYCWFRDGAFIAEGVSKYGGVESADRFFDWCARILESRSAHINHIVASAAAGKPVTDREMLPTRFTFDGDDGSDAWWDFQLDGYGTWLWAVLGHSARHGVDPKRWQNAISLTVDYLLSSWRRPCFDWWEENSAQVHGSTLGCIVGGLAAAAASGALDEHQQQSAMAAVEEIRTLLLAEGTIDGRLRKWLGSAEMDASLVAIVHPLGAFPATEAVGFATIEAVDATLTVGNGVHRYLADTFYGGGQWPLLSCMLGSAYMAAGNSARAEELLQWAARTATPESYIPEQVGEHLLDATRRDEWLERWGSVATPLLWSHAMFISLALDLGYLSPVHWEVPR